LVIRVAGTPKGKKHLHVLIDEELYKLLIETAPGVYGQGKYRGALSYIVEDALRQYLLPRAHKNTQNNPNRSVKHVYGLVKDKVKEIMKLDYAPDEVPEKILDLAIAEVRGSDPRTIAKWKGIFEKSKLIKYLGGFPPNRIVELL
jgi:hypothetical protein